MKYQGKYTRFEWNCPDVQYESWVEVYEFIMRERELQKLLIELASSSELENDSDFIESFLQFLFAERIMSDLRFDNVRLTRARLKGLLNSHAEFVRDNLDLFNQRVRSQSDDVLLEKAQQIYEFIWRSQPKKRYQERNNKIFGFWAEDYYEDEVEYDAAQIQALYKIMARLGWKREQDLFKAMIVVTKTTTTGKMVLFETMLDKYGRPDFDKISKYIEMQKSFLAEATNHFDETHWYGREWKIFNELCDHFEIPEFKINLKKVA